MTWHISILTMLQTWNPQMRNTETRGITSIIPEADTGLWVMPKVTAEAFAIRVKLLFVPTAAARCAAAISYRVSDVGRGHC